MPKRERVVRVDGNTFEWAGTKWVRYEPDGTVLSLEDAELALLRALLRCRKRLARVLEDWVPRHARRKPGPPYTLKHAKRMRVCRVCGEDQMDGPGLPFVYDYGKEYAHQKCLKGGRHAR